MFSIACSSRASCASAFLFDMGIGCKQFMEMEITGSGVSALSTVRKCGHNVL